MSRWPYVVVVELEGGISRHWDGVVEAPRDDWDLAMEAEEEEARKGLGSLVEGREVEVHIGQMPPVEEDHPR